MPHSQEAEVAGVLRQRLREVIGGRGDTGRFAERAGIPKDTLNKYLGGMQPGPAALIKIADAGGVSIDYLLGRSESRHLAVSGKEPSDLATDVLGLGERRAPPEGFVVVPQLDIRASAGGGRSMMPYEELAGSEIAFRESWLRNLGVTPRNAQLLSAVGDSMEPTIRDGDLLLVDRGIDRVVDNGIYVVVLAGLVMVKRLQVLFDGSLVLASDNKQAYPDPEKVPQERVHDLVVEGRVRWCGRAV